MKKIRIPESIDKAGDRLAVLDGIATAAGWERAAIVYAFTYEGSKGGRPSKDGNLLSTEQVYTVAKFAALKIKGLASRNTIDGYRDAWKDAITNGEAEDIQPGELIVLPTSPFPPIRTGTDGYNSAEGAQKTIEKIVAKHGPEVLNPIIAKPEVGRAVVDDEEAWDSVREGFRSKTRKPHPGPQRPSRRNLDPQDQAEDEMTGLQLQTLLVEFEVIASAAADVRKAHDIVQQMRPYLNDEYRYDLAAAASKASEAWELIRALVMSEGVTDMALEDLIRQEQGGAA